MRLISWLFRILLFVLALGFALSNTGVTELRFFGVEIAWRAPLVIFLLVFFAAGALLGLLGVVPTWFRLRREIGRLKRELRVAEKTAAAPTAVAPPDVPAPSALPLSRPEA
jgi:putative membrane protein